MKQVKEQVKGQLIGLSFPIYVELILQLFVGNVDQVMVGWFNIDGVGAIGNVNQIVSLVLVTFSISSSASVILISKYLGEGNRKQVKETYCTSILISLVLGASVSLFLFIFGDEILRALNLKGDMYEQSTGYMRIISIGLVFQSLYQTVLSFLRSQKMMKMTMVVSIIMNTINVLGNYFLIFGFGAVPAFGVVGAGLASTIARFLGLIIISVIFIKKVLPSYKNEEGVMFSRLQLKKVLKIGVPTAGESISYGISQVCIQFICNGFAAYMINARVYLNMLASFSFICAEAVSGAAQVIISHQMGQGEYREVKASVKTSVLLSVFSAGGIAILMFLFTEPIFKVFTSDTEVIQIARVVTGIEIIRSLGRAVNVNMCRILPVCNDILYPVGISTVFAWVIGVGGCYLFGNTLGMQIIGLWIAMALDEVLRAIIFTCRFYNAKWQKRTFVERGGEKG